MPWRALSPSPVVALSGVTVALVDIYIRCHLSARSDDGQGFGFSVWQSSLDVIEACGLAWDVVVVVAVLRCAALRAG